MDDTKGWTIFGCVAAVCVTIIVMSTQVYWQSTNRKIVEMTLNGSDPVAAAVALDSIYDEKAKTYFMSKR